MLSDRDMDTVCDQYIDAMIWAHTQDDIDRIMDVVCRDSDIDAYHFRRLVMLAKSFRDKLGMAPVPLIL